MSPLGLWSTQHKTTDATNYNLTTADMISSKFTESQANILRKLQQIFLTTFTEQVVVRAIY